MDATILDGLFSRYVAQDFKTLGIMPFMDHLDLEENWPEVYGELNPDIAGELEDAIADYGYLNERTGFIGGVKVGMRLARELFGGDNVSCRESDE